MNKLFILLSLALISCKEELSQPVSPPGMIIRVVNNVNAPLSGARVNLFTSPESWESETGAVATQVTDTKGEVHFSNLESQHYWVKATLLRLLSNEVYQNILVSYEPVERSPAGSTVAYEVKVNSAKALQGVRIKRVELLDFHYPDCDAGALLHK